MNDDKMLEMFETLVEVRTNTKNIVDRLDKFETKQEVTSSLVNTMCKDVNDLKETKNDHENRIKALEDNQNFNFMKFFKETAMGKIVIFGVAVGIISLIAMVMMQFYSFQNMIGGGTP